MFVLCFSEFSENVGYTRQHFLILVCSVEIESYVCAGVISNQVSSKYNIRKVLPSVAYVVTKLRKNQNKHKKQAFQVRAVWDFKNFNLN